jgi:hypothetical protein
LKIKISGLSLREVTVLAFNAADVTFTGGLNVGNCVVIISKIEADWSLKLFMAEPSTEGAGALSGKTRKIASV